MMAARAKLAPNAVPIHHFAGSDRNPFAPNCGTAALISAFSSASHERIDCSCCLRGSGVRLAYLETRTKLMLIPKVPLPVPDLASGERVITSGPPSPDLQTITSL